MAVAKKVASKKAVARKAASKRVVAKKSTSKKVPTKRVAAKRTLVEPHPGDKRYVRRDEDGKFDESVDVSKSLSQDDRKKSGTVARPGQGNKGDHKPAK